MQPTSIPWELIWRVLRVGLLAMMAYLSEQLQPLVVQGDTPVNFGPGFLAGVLGLLSAAEAVYAALKQLGWIKTKDAPAVRAKQPLPPGVVEAVAGSYIPAGQMVYVLPAGSVMDVTTPGDKSRVFVTPYSSPPVFSGPLHDPAKDTPQPAD